MTFATGKRMRLRISAPFIARRLLIRLTIVCTTAFALSQRAPAQTRTSEPQLGRIMGTVTDANGDAAVGASVVLQGPGPDSRRTLVTDENGLFQFNDVKPGGPYQIVVSATGFVGWTSPAMTVAPGEFKQLGGVTIHLETQHTTVQVTYNPEQIATQQLKLEETQRVFGIVPNFYISYDPSAAPLTAKLKFKLALKVSVDPVTVAGVFLVAGVKQAADTPAYRQGAIGYGERLGADAGDGLTDIMVGGAILPSLVHQDPRYFYQGTGTTKSRIRHAMLSPFIAKGDNGNWQPNYSSIGGDLAASGMSNLYYPRRDRGAGLVFQNFAIGTAERLGASLAQEFLLGRLTHRGGHIQ